MLDKNILISVIVPIYNSSLYLEECIKSILSQTYINLEIILINDGSTDNSFEICTKYKQNDDRIILINSKNEGVSSARNKGIMKSTGKYIIFVDSDDIIKEDFVETLIKNNDNNYYDIVMCNYTEFNEENQLKHHKCVEKEDENFFEFITLNYLWEPWGKLINKKIIKNYFKTDISIAEDLLFWYDNLQDIKYKWIEYDGYLYRNNNNSTMRNRVVTPSVMSEFKAFGQVIEKATFKCKIKLMKHYINKAYNVKSNFKDDNDLFKSEKKKVIYYCKKYYKEILIYKKNDINEIIKLGIKVFLLIL